MKRPFSLLILPLSFGIYVFYNISFSVYFLVMTICILLILLSLTLYKGRGFKVIIVITIFCLGGLILYNNINDSKLMKFKDKYSFVEGTIDERLNIEEEYSRYIFTVEKIENNKIQYKVEEKIVLSVTGDQYWDVGDKLKIEGVLVEPKRNSNPHLFNYKLYLQGKNIHTVMTAKEYAVSFIGKDKLSIMENLSYNFQNRVEMVFDFSLSQRNSNIMKSIILGDDSYIDDKTLKEFRDLGIAHILAVSGLHVGIIAYMFVFILKSISIDKRTSTIIVLVILWTYGYLIGFPPSVLRALIMFSILLISSITLRRYDPINSLSFGAFILLVVNPLWLFNPGFQLSFVATLSLLLFTKPIGRINVEGNKKLFSAIWPLIAVQLGIIPVSLYHFNSMPLLSVFVNLLVIPLMSIGVMLGFLIIVLSLLSLRLCFYIGMVLNLLLNVSLGITSLLGKLPWTTILLGSPSIFDIALYYIVILILLKLIRLDYLSFSINKSILIYLVSLNLALSVSGIMNEDVKVEFIDVGQGDSSLITTEGKSFLIDSGGTLLSSIDIGESILGPYLTKRGIRKLEGIYISHFHEDHCEGVLYLIENIEVGKLFIGYEKPENNLYARIIKKAKAKKIPIIFLNRGDEVKISDHTSIEVLHPGYEDRNLYDNENNLSLVLLLKTHGKTLFFTGDIEKIVEDKIVNDIGEMNIDIIKVPHHGSKTSSSISLIDSMNPAAAIISVGKNNFGHPNSEVIRSYKDENVEIYRTDNDGMVTVDIDKKSLNISRYLVEKPRPADIIAGNWIELLMIIMYFGVGILIIKIYNNTV